MWYGQWDRLPTKIIQISRKFCHLRMWTEKTFKNQRKSLFYVQKKKLQKLHSENACWSNRRWSDWQFGLFIRIRRDKSLQSFEQKLVGNIRFSWKLLMSFWKLPKAQIKCCLETLMLFVRSFPGASENFKQTIWKLSTNTWKLFWYLYKVSKHVQGTSKAHAEQLRITSPKR